MTTASTTRGRRIGSEVCTSACHNFETAPHTTKVPAPTPESTSGGNTTNAGSGSQL
jgi:hypothetical protein